MREVTVSDLHRTWNDRLDSQWIDVRSPSEFATGHLPGAVNIPVDQIEARRADLRADSPLVLVCQAGTRARMAARLLAPSRPDVAVLTGGTDAWIKAGLPVVQNSKTRWSLERQVRLGAGLIVLFSVLLAVTVNPRWLYLTAFVGSGLSFAGVTDLCPMAMLLAKLPWNSYRARTAVSAACKISNDSGSRPENDEILFSWTLNRSSMNTKTRSTGR
jgi:rhodanese-related sulfurtransferase